MRVFPLVLLLGLTACVGQLRDFVGPRSSIVSPQLIRYGLDVTQARCVGERLGETLGPKPLRLFTRNASAVRQGYYDASRLTMRDLAWVATAMHNSEVSVALARANAACGVAVVVPRDPPPVVAVAASAPRRATWLNLGAAPSGQSIAIDASTIEQEGALRSAWFRLTNPGAAAPSADTYLLHIDCGRRTINSKTRQRHDATGAVTDTVEYPDNPLAVEGGTVMEIAFLSLCT